MVDSFQHPRRPRLQYFAPQPSVSDHHQDDGVCHSISKMRRSQSVKAVAVSDPLAGPKRHHEAIISGPRKAIRNGPTSIRIVRQSKFFGTWNMDVVLSEGEI